MGLWLSGCDRPVVKGLELEGVTPAWSCAAGADPAGQEALILRGEGLGISVEGSLRNPRIIGPNVRFVPETTLAGEPWPDGSEGEVQLVWGDPRLQLEGTSVLRLPLGGALGLSAAVYRIEVEGADGRTASLRFVSLGAPDLGTPTPKEVCAGDAAVTFAVPGSMLLLPDGESPEVLVDGVVMGGSTFSECAPLPEPLSGQACSGFELSLQPGSLGLGAHTLSLQNPEAVDCGASNVVAVTVSPPPILRGVSPDRVCETGALLTVTGVDLAEGQTLRLGGVPLEVESVAGSNTIVARLPADALAAGVYPLEIEAPGGCEAVLDAAVEVSVNPVSVRVDPPVLPEGIGGVVELQVVGAFEALTEVRLEAPGLPSVRVDWSSHPEGDGRLVLEIPSDLPAGVWTPVVHQGEDCPGTPAASLTIVAADQLALDRVEPGFAWAYDYTPLEVIPQVPAPEGAVALVPGAQAWILDPSGVEPPARLLGAALTDAGNLAGILPYGLSAGSWDLLVANPDGSAGLLVGAVEVVEEAPPLISSVSPGTIANTGSEVLTLLGRDFRDPQVGLTCASGGVESEVTATVLTWSSTRVVVVPDVGGFGQAVCVVRIENADGTSARFSAFSVTNPAQNLFPWSSGTSMGTPRRAPAAVAGRTTSVRRWLYAIGGDDGEASGALRSIERAAVGVYGDLGPWQTMPRELATPLTLSAVAEVDGFVYLVGGEDGSGVVDTTYRAQVLDPLVAPWFVDAQLSAVDAGLGAGQWSWRVAAVYDPLDPTNPGGEGLATDLLPLSLPATGGPWAVHLAWESVPGAVAYRVYRSPSADSTPGVDERLVAEVTGLEYVDVGEAVDPTVAPLAEGDLGAFAVVAHLQTGRRSACLAQAPDPFPDPERIYLYAAGGADASGTPLADIEVLDITIEAPGRQTVGSWTDAGVDLTRARERCGGAAVDATWHSVVEPGESWVYFIGGRTNSGATGVVDAAWVDEDGVLRDIGAIRSMSPARAGMALASASNFLYVFGGQQDGPSSSGTSAELTAANLPDVRNWNSLGTALSEARWLAGSAQESAVVFVVGGQTDTAPASATVDWTSF